MNHRPGALNRVGLVLTAVVLLLVGAAGLLLASGSAGRLAGGAPQAQDRVADDPEAGLTSVSARVLADAVAADVTSLPGATGADVVVRGAADRPELVIAVTARTDADLAGLLAEIRHGVVGRFETAVGAPVRHTGIRLDLVRQRADADQLTVA